ncbi:MAG: hypothetical protein AAGD38_10460 [Acidobacteriota bacterium]
MLALTGVAAATPPEVEVVVRERGEPIQGLTAENFVVTLADREIPVRVDEIRDGRRLSDATTVATDVLIYIDEVFLIAPRRNKVLRRLSRELDQLGPDDRVAIVVGDRDEVDVLTGWTRALTLLRSAIDTAQDRASHGLERLGEQRQRENQTVTRTPADFSSIGFSGYSLAPRELGSVGLHRANEVSTQIADLVGGMRAALVAVDRPATDTHRRKVLVPLLGAWPISPEAWVVDGSDGPAAGRAAARELFRPIVDTAVRFGYGIYPMVVEGWDIPGRTVASRDAAAYDMLEWLAATSGGRQLENGRGADMLPTVLADHRDAYFVALEWPTNVDGDPLPLDIRLADGSARAELRAPTRIADPDAKQWRRELLADAQRFGVEQRALGPINEERRTTSPD